MPTVEEQALVASEEMLLTEEQESDAYLPMYTNREVDSVRHITLTGEPVQVTAANQDSYIGHYYRAEDGLVYRFTGVTT